MIETEKMQQLHQAAATGQTLADEDRRALELWYQTLDRKEAAINQQNRSVDIETLRATVAARTAQIAVAGEEVAALLQQNEVLRRENEVLRRRVEARLTAEQPKIAA